MITEMEPGIDYDLLPPHLQAGMRRYIEQGIETGSFLRAVLENDLEQAFGRADFFGIVHMELIVSFLRALPPEAWGSSAKVQAWIDLHKRERLEKAN